MWEEQLIAITWPSLTQLIPQISFLLVSFLVSVCMYNWKYCQHLSQNCFSWFFMVAWCSTFTILYIIFKSQPNQIVSCHPGEWILPWPIDPRQIESSSLDKHVIYKHINTKMNSYYKDCRYAIQCSFRGRAQSLHQAHEAVTLLAYARFKAMCLVMHSGLRGGFRKVNIKLV